MGKARRQCGAGLSGGRKILPQGQQLPREPDPPEVKKPMFYEIFRDGTGFAKQLA
jgi:hypothetical protein